MTKFILSFPANLLNTDPMLVYDGLGQDTSPDFLPCRFKPSTHLETGIEPNQKKYFEGLNHGRRHAGLNEPFCVTEMIV